MEQSEKTLEDKTTEVGNQEDNAVAARWKGARALEVSRYGQRHGDKNKSDKEESIFHLSGHIFEVNDA